MYAAYFNAKRRKIADKIWSWRDWFKPGEAKRQFKTVEEQRKQFIEETKRSQRRRKLNGVR